METAPGVLEQLPALGIGGIIGVFAIWLLNKAWRDHTENTTKMAKEHADTIKGFHDIERGRTEMLVGVIKENTNQTVKNTTVLDSLHRRLDRDAAERGEKI